MRDAVALLLADDHVARELAVVGPLVEHALEQLRRTDDVGAGLLEEVEELALLGGEELGQSGHGGPVYVNGLLGRQTDAAVRRAHRAPEPLELLRRDAVGVLRAREGAAAHLLGVGPHAAHHLLADRRVSA